MKSQQTVAVIDFGSQYTQLIARRIREQKVFSEICSNQITAEELKTKNVKAIILSGGPESVYENEASFFIDVIEQLDIPVLGICYGLHLLVQSLGGEINTRGSGEYGFAKVHKTKESPLFKNISSEIQVWMSHGDEVIKCPESCKIIASSSNNIIAAVQHTDKPYYGVQFHPEVSHTVDGDVILSNFLFNIAYLTPDWTPANFVQDSVQSIRQKVGTQQIICGLSGGVDSSVVATLIHKAVGDQLTCIFIDNGLLRKNEFFQVMTSLKKRLGLNIIQYDHSQKFLSKLAGVIDPEQKRKIIGEEFILSFEAAAHEIGEVDFLAQGTLYPDVIESGGLGIGPSAMIKSHHNVGGLPEDMNFDLIEPVNDLFKDEVRRVGLELGLPDHLLERHPFPGPGLAVRILGEITVERLEILRNADQIFINDLMESNEYGKIWQAFAVLLPIKTVGVMGDLRTYEYVIALRAVTSLDGMTADWYEFPPEILKNCSNRIVNKVRGVNRVVYDITGKPPGTIEWE